MHPLYNVLFLCTGNSARSIVAESLLLHWGAGRFRAFSAGSHPTGNVNPLAIELLQSLNLPTAQARSKSWDEFAAPSAPKMDFVITVCDRAAGEICPIWPGQPVVAHWSIPDPAAVRGSEIERKRAFRKALRQLENRLKPFAALGLEALDRLVAGKSLSAIHRDATDIG